MGVVAGIAAAAISAGATVYSSQQANKRAKAGQEAAAGAMPDFSGIKIPKVKIWSVARNAAGFNANEGYNNAQNIAKRSNANAVTDLEDAMGRMYGSPEAFHQQRDETNNIIEDHLAGNVSASTRQELGRHMLDSGVTSLGDGASGDEYAAYLGLTKESLQTQGAGEYRSLYSMYRQALPLVSASDNLRYTTIDPGQMVQAAQNEAMNRFNSALALRGAQYGVAYNGQVMQQGYNNSRTQADNQMAAGLAQSAGSALATYQKYQQPGTNQYGMSYTASSGTDPAANTGDYNAFTGSGTSTGPQVSEGL